MRGNLLRHVYAMALAASQMGNTFDSEVGDILAREPYQRGSRSGKKSGSENCKKPLKARAKAKRGKKARRKMYAARK